MLLCVFGDSFVAGIGDPHYQGWIGRAVSALKRSDISLYNLGVRGQTGAEILARLHAEATPRLNTDRAERLMPPPHSSELCLERHALNQGHTAPASIERAAKGADAPVRPGLKGDLNHPAPHLAQDGLDAKPLLRPAPSGQFQSNGHGIIVSFGANDCAAGPHAAPRRTPKQSQDDLRDILAIAGKLAPTLMIGPAPIADDPAADARIADLCPQFQTICAEHGIAYIPVHTKLRGSPLWMQEALSGDGAHPGSGGYAVMAELIVANPQWAAFFQPT